MAKPSWHFGITCLHCILLSIGAFVIYSHLGCKLGQESLKDAGQQPCSAQAGISQAAAQWIRRAEFNAHDKLGSSQAQCDNGRVHATEEVAPNPQLVSKRAIHDDMCLANLGLWTFAWGQTCPKADQVAVSTESAPAICFPKDFISSIIEANINSFRGAQPSDVNVGAVSTTVAWNPTAPPGMCPFFWTGTPISLSFDRGPAVSYGSTPVHFNATHQCPGPLSLCEYVLGQWAHTTSPQPGRATDEGTWANMRLMYLYTAVLVSVLAFTFQQLRKKVREDQRRSPPKKTSPCQLATDVLPA